jgi:hypothetical protein
MLAKGFILVVLDEDARVGNRLCLYASVLLAQKRAYIESLIVGCGLLRVVNCEDSLQADINKAVICH